MKYKNTKASLDDDNLNGLQSSITGYNKPTVVHDMDFYLDEPIGEPSYYRGLLQYLFDMEEHDSCRIWINTPGGNLSSAIAIISAMQETQGQVTCIVNANAYSAGSMIALASPMLIVGEYADMMLHTASYGSLGKSSDVSGMVKHSDSYIRKIMQDCYEGFLTDAELELMLQGRDYWFGADEIIARLEKRKVYQEKAAVESNVKSKVKPKTTKPKV